MVLEERASFGVHSLTICSVWARPASRLAVRSWMSCWAVEVPAGVEGFGADGPDRGYPGEAGELAPKVG